MKQRFRNKRRRVERQEEATERQARYDALTPMDRMLLLDDRPGAKAREWARIKTATGTFYTHDFDGEPIPGVWLA